MATRDFFETIGSEDLVSAGNCGACRRESGSAAFETSNSDDLNRGARMKYKQTYLAATILFAAVLGAVSSATAQTWPTRTVTMVVPFAAGSASDTAGRVLAAGLSEVLGQQVIVENIGGGGSMIGTARVAKSAPDGYQFVFASVDSMAIVPAMHKQVLYNTIADFTPVGLVVDQPIVLIARKDLPANTMQEFVSYAKANDKAMQFGSSGVGSSSHFACARLDAAIGVNPAHVPYRGSGLAMQDLIAGRIDYFCALGAAAIGPLDGGAAKAIALLTAERSALFPNLKTANEMGVKGADTYSWTGFFFPKGTPEEIVKKLSEATDKVLSSPKTIERLQKVGVAPIPAEQRSPAYLTKFIRSEVDTWSAAVKASGIPIE
jgi:tripartite-type tricarboxylate transporter receptor subunit TctC